MVMKEYSIVKYIKFADLVTILSLLSGFAAIVFFSNGDFKNGSIAILAAAFFDWIDGKVARVLGGGTSFGKALDFADLISFGAAPAFFLVKIFPNYIGYTAAAIFLTATLLRLARFNITDTKFSIGMPTTFNGVLFPLVYFLQTYFSFSQYIYVVLALLSSILMLSSFRLGK